MNSHKQKCQCDVNGCFLGTRGGSFVFGSLVGTAPLVSTSGIVSGTCTWAGKGMEILGRTPKHSPPLLPGNKPLKWQLGIHWTGR